MGCTAVVSVFLFELCFIYQHTMHLQTFSCLQGYIVYISCSLLFSSALVYCCFNITTCHHVLQSAEMCSWCEFVSAISLFYGHNSRPCEMLRTTGADVMMSRSLCCFHRLYWFLQALTIFVRVTDVHEAYSKLLLQLCCLTIFRAHSLGCEGNTNYTCSQEI